jgi:hypothetical protein
MFRVFFAMLVSIACTTGTAVGADLPSLVKSKVPAQPKHVASQKLRPLKPRKTVHNLQPAAAVPKKADVTITIEPSDLPATTPLTLSWVLKPMVANADGGKIEGSASETGYIVIEKPGTLCGPEMLINLHGHIVKTTNSTVRLDIQVGHMQRSIIWSPDKIESGKFNIALTEKSQACVSGNYIPVTALAFVTKEGHDHAAMISLEKVILRYEGPQIVGSQ